MRRGIGVGVVLLLALGLFPATLHGQGNETSRRPRPQLGQNYPNPFNPETRIPFELPAEMFESGEGLQKEIASEEEQYPPEVQPDQQKRRDHRCQGAVPAGDHDGEQGEEQRLAHQHHAGILANRSRFGTGCTRAGEFPGDRAHT